MTNLMESRNKLVKDAVSNLAQVRIPKLPTLKLVGPNVELLKPQLALAKGVDFDFGKHVLGN